MDEEIIRSDIWIFQGYLQKLEAATNKHEQAISDLNVSDINLKMAYTSKLTQQQRLTDPILVQLQTRIDFLENKSAPTSACVQTKVCSMQKAIEAKMNAILNAHKEEDMLFSILKITANLQLLDDVITDAITEQDVVYRQDEGHICGSPE